MGCAIVQGLGEGGLAGGGGDIFPGGEEKLVVGFEALKFAAASAELLANGVAGDLFDPDGEVA